LLEVLDILQETNSLLQRHTSNVGSGFTGVLEVNTEVGASAFSS
jgi:hypothetical protein